MKVAFLLIDDPVGDEVAGIMCESVRRVMPGVELVQMTGTTDKIVPGCSVKRKERGTMPMMLYRLHQLAEFGNEELICLDTDIWVQHDLAKVFAFPFDMALTWRDGPIYDASDEKRVHDMTKQMPINCGVMFSRTAQFWLDCAQMLKGAHESLQNWFGDQMAVAHIAKRYNVLRLHCDNWNKTPGSEEEDVSKAFAAHYKGRRKSWMVERARRERIAAQVSDNAFCS